MSENDKIYNFMKELNRKAAQELMRVYNNRPSDVPIKFPKYCNGKKEGQTRVSEQELRFTMAYLFNKVKPINEDYFFSIETPTEKKYVFSENKEGLDSDSKDQGKRSAQTDMTLYEGSKPRINIEFKANNPEQESFDKDIEKLLTENKIGAWCHVLENANNGTWRRLLGKSKKSRKPGKFENAFNKVININVHKVKPKPIYFSFLVLNEDGKSAFYWKELEYNEGDKDSIFNITSGQDMVNNGWGKWILNDQNELIEEK